jgi:hypothetical protein
MEVYVDSQTKEVLEILHQRVSEESAIKLRKSFDDLMMLACAPNRTNDVSCSPLAGDFARTLDKWVSDQTRTLPEEPQMEASFGKEAFKTVTKELSRLWTEKTGLMANSMVVCLSWKRYLNTKIC